MIFTINGHYRGEPASITWEDGQLSGHESAVKAFEKMASEREKVFYAPIGVLSSNAHLSKPLPTAVLLFEFLRPVIDWSGQVPDLPDVPPDAVS